MRFVLIIFSIYKNNLSEEQKLFNKLVQQIEKKKKELDKWDKCAEDYGYRHHEKLSPIEEEFNNYRAEFVYVLDKASLNKGLTKREKEKIITVICDISNELLSIKHNEKLAAIFSKNQAIEKEMQGKNKGNFFDDFIEGIEEAMKDRIEDEEEKYRSDRIDDEEDYYRPQETTEDKECKESLKDVYRNLASNLHPDKELDELEKSRKNKLMQDINIAYKEKNLVELLRIQLEEEKNQQIDIEKIAEGKVGSYNKAFKRQLLELRGNVSAIKRSFQRYYPDLKMSGLTENKINERLEKNIEYSKKMLAKSKKEMEGFGKDIKSIKSFLKSVERDSLSKELERFMY